MGTVVVPRTGQLARRARVGIAWRDHVQLAQERAEAGRPAAAERRASCPDGMMDGVHTALSRVIAATGVVPAELSSVAGVVMPGRSPAAGLLTEHGRHEAPEEADERGSASGLR